MHLSITSPSSHLSLTSLTSLPPFPSSLFTTPPSLCCSAVYFTLQLETLLRKGQTAAALEKVKALSSMEDAEVTAALGHLPLPSELEALPGYKGKRGVLPAGAAGLDLPSPLSSAALNAQALLLGCAAKLGWQTHVLQRIAEHLLNGRVRTVTCF